MYRPKQSPVFSIRCSCCLRSKYMRELLDKDCADITDPQSYAETWLSFPSPDGSRKNGDEIKEPSLRTADFLLAHRRWETFREEKSLRLSDRNSILMTQNLSGIRSEALIGRRSASSWTVPQRRWARRNVCRSQAKKKTDPKLIRMLVNDYFLCPIGVQHSNESWNWFR